MAGGGDDRGGGDKPGPRRGRGFPLTLDQMVQKPVRASAAPPTASSTATSAVSQRPALPAARPLPAKLPRPLLRPQGPLQHAAVAASTVAAPSGLGMDSADVRLRMVQRLRAAGLQHEQVLQALATVPRHHFVDAALVIQAYEDTSLPIGHGQTISKPSVVGRMIELLMAGDNARNQGHLGRALEIGTGCGYQAALLGLLSRQLISVERLKPLHDKARELLAPLRPAHLRLVYGDGMLGHPPNAPYDSIIAAAGGDAVPQAWLDQLAVGGRLVAPVVSGGQRQVLVVIDHKSHGFERSEQETVRFVPLKSGVVR